MRKINEKGNNISEKKKNMRKNNNFSILGDFIKEEEWWEEYKIVKDPKDFFGNKIKGEFIEIANVQVPLELAKKYNSEDEFLKDNLK